MNNKAQADSLHMGLLILAAFLILIIGVIFWYLLTSPSVTNKIAPGATQITIDHHEWPLAFTCDYIKPDGTPLRTEKNGTVKH